MEQLIMNWQNDGSVAKMPEFPEGVELRTLPQLSDGVAHWLEIIRFMEQTESPETPYKVFEDCLLKWPDYDENLCFFLTVDGAPAATLTVICHREKSQGYVHMVACKPHFRGKGLGTLLSHLAAYVLLREGMQTAYLTTDDWRVPAIKTYLRAGFVPDTESQPDFRERWEKILSQI